MKRRRIVMLVAGALLAGSVATAAIVRVRDKRPIVLPSWLAPHHELAEQLHDRGSMAVVGSIPFDLRFGETPLVPADSLPALKTALAGTDALALANAIRTTRVDGLLVRTDTNESFAPNSLAARMHAMKAVPGVSATWLGASGALYELRPDPSVPLDDAKRLIAVVRVVLQGAAPPAERLFPASMRRAEPTEVAVIVRDGNEPVLWRAVRGGSIARALVDATYAVFARWTTRQQASYGPLREAITRLPITIAIFHDRGTLGARTADFLARAADPHVFAVGYDLTGNWEFQLPPAPGAPVVAPDRALADLAHEHDVPAPGWLRPELHPYRFRALQIIEQTALNEVHVVDP